MKFRKAAAEIVAVLAIGMSCAACGSIDYESSSSNSSANIAASLSADEDETEAAERSSIQQSSAEITEEYETTEDLTTEATTGSEIITTAKKKKTATTTTTAVTTASTTTENSNIKEFREYFSDDDEVPYNYFPEIDESEIPSTVSDDASYVSDYKTKHFMWLDVEKEIDYTFNGKFIKISLKVKDDTPSGNYPILMNTDVSNVMGLCLNRKIEVFDGEIAVGKSIAGSTGITSGNAPSIYADNITAMPGETVDYYIYFDNNPGIAAFLLNIAYDSNAFDWISTESCGEFLNVPSARAVNCTN